MADRFSDYWLASSDNLEHIIQLCFTEGFDGRDCKFNPRQCMDIAGFLAETAPFREHAWEWIGVLKCTDQASMWDQAIMEFCRAIVEAKIFLEVATDFNFNKNAYESLTKLETGEAYEVLLHNLIWSKAGLEVAMLYAGTENANVDYIVKECKLLLSKYGTASRQHCLDIDRAEFYRSVENSELYPEEMSQKKRLTFLVQKSKDAGDGVRNGNLDAFELDPHDIDHHGKDVLALGAYGIVYSMSWLGERVAVKVFKGMPQELFKEEASLLAGLQNPFIVHMVGWCTQKEDNMLVMELAQTDLKTVIDKSSFTISLPAAVDIMLQISKGMEYLHKKGIVHRDIKPSNVLCEPCCIKGMAAQGYARAKLCDFGLAKVKELSAEDRSQYTTLKLGTAYYRAPEVLFDDDEAVDSKYTCKVDVFSFAITCCEILAGKTGPACYPPNLSSTRIRELMLANVRPTLPRDCPSHLAGLIECCWDTKPEGRPPFSRISHTLTYIKFILARVSDVQRLPYDALVTPFDEEVLEMELNSGRAILDEDSAKKNTLEDADKLVEGTGGRAGSLKSGESLESLEWIMSSCGYKLIMQSDGNLVLKSPSQDLLWESKSSYRQFRYAPPRGAQGGCRCTLRDDGNLVVSTYDGDILWQSNSFQVGPHTLLLHNDGRLSITNRHGKCFWTTPRDPEFTSFTNV